MRKRALGERDDDQVTGDGNRRTNPQQCLERSERLQGLQSIGMSAMQGKERRIQVCDGNGNRNSDAPPGLLQFDASLLGYKIMLERLDQSFDAMNHAIESPLQIQHEISDEPAQFATSDGKR
ncbi:uncharacterized protein EAF01_008443 [Botrytis porri]|uniref:Uncharacterized protein n=1 Tax=Botrytis porri TaxID=87229 RepID=A0A4Z1L4W8_9HELO|nr:uncharacterized protein EAF01_008443 [Botrytis porri]KAF7899230.1 hypothetical protein EAF01_008443 [Botrytis porri]TGO91726.1 hypothetical protein BPOR_0020g00210 [Botrytis porri]